MAMTLDSERKAFEKWAGENGFGTKFRESMFAAWEARAHLSQTAQAVDVGAIREVIAELRAGAEIRRTSSSRTQTDKNVAGYLDRQADKLTRAIAAPPSNSPTTGAIGENGNG